MYIIFDVNHTAAKAAYARANSDQYLKSEEDRDDLISAISTSFNAVIRRYNRIDGVIFCLDSTAKSWRYQLPYKDIYKSGRSKSLPRYDRQGYKMAIEKFHNKLNDHGYCSLMFDMAEGDDLIYLSSQLLYNNDNSVLVVSGDKDMQQLVSTKGNNFVSLFSSVDVKNTCHYVDAFSKERSDSEMSIDDFFNNDVEQTNKEIIRQKCVPIIPEESLFVKILSGDKSDSIPSCFFYQKGTQQFGFTDLRAKSVFDKYYHDMFSLKQRDIFFVFHDPEAIETLARYVIKEVGKEDTKETVDQVVRNIITNRQYIMLHYSSFIDQNFYDKLEKYCISRMSQGMKGILLDNNFIIDRS